MMREMVANLRDDPAEAAEAAPSASAQPPPPADSRPQAVIDSVLVQDPTKDLPAVAR